jgi:hypothetical protein
VDEIGDLALQEQHCLPDVQKFRGIFAENVHAQKLQRFAVK